MSDERTVDDEAVHEIQQLYLACHVDHVRAASTEWQLSSRDSSILSHLDRHVGLSPGQLSAHLGVTASTLSAAIARLARLGYVESAASDADKRRRQLRLTARGAEAMASTSVLDRERVRLLLAELKPAEHEAGLRGLTLLAFASRQMKESK